MAIRYYVQFYSTSTGYVEGSCPPIFDDAHVKPIEATGDRGIMIVDGRTKFCNVENIAKQDCKKRDYIGYRIYKGESISNMVPLTKYIPI